MKRKVLTIMFVGVLSISSLAGCGNDTKPKSEETVIQTETESIEKDVVEETEETTETEEKESEITETEVKATEVPKEEVTSTTVPKTKDKPKESKTEKTTKPTEKPTEAPTKAPHQHSYSSSVTKNSTCSESGIKTYQCSCGDSYTENIAPTGHSWNGGEYIQNGTCSSEVVKRFTCSSCGATEDKGTGEYGNHNFVAQQQTIHHEGSGHYETVRYIECGCGAGPFYDSSSFRGHQEETGHTHSTFFENEQWIVDSKVGTNR